MNVNHPFAMGEWKLLGPVSQTEGFEQAMNQNLSKWYVLKSIHKEEK